MIAMGSNFFTIVIRYMIDMGSFLFFTIIIMNMCMIDMGSFTFVEYNDNMVVMGSCIFHNNKKKGWSIWDHMFFFTLIVYFGYKWQY